MNRKPKGIRAFMDCSDIRFSLTGIYSITHTKNPGWYYIGCTSKVNDSGKSGFAYRWSNHLNLLKTKMHINKKLQLIVNNKGIEGLSFEILEVCEPELCKSLEYSYLIKYSKIHNLYNVVVRDPNATKKLKKKNAPLRDAINILINCIELMPSKKKTNEIERAILTAKSFCKRNYK